MVQGMTSRVFVHVGGFQIDACPLAALMRGCAARFKISFVVGNLRGVVARRILSGMI